MAKKSRNFKRILPIGDFHCGHAVGLTPSSLNPRYDDEKKNELSAYREGMWAWFMTKLGPYKPFDIAVINGDSIDGKGERSGGVEQITTDRNEQIQMARTIIDWISPKDVEFVAGTPYHTGVQEDWELALARHYNKELHGELNLEVNGKILNFKHFISGSGIPHGRATGLMRDRLWNQLWAEGDEFPKADAIFRSHVHYNIVIDQPEYLGAILPALQGYGSHYGIRKVSGKVHFGFMVVDIDNDTGDITWHRHILRMPYSPPIAVK
jgi:hypothetical protein